MLTCWNNKALRLAVIAAVGAVLCRPAAADWMDSEGESTASRAGMIETMLSGSFVKVSGNASASATLGAGYFINDWHEVGCLASYLSGGGRTIASAGGFYAYYFDIGASGWLPYVGAAASVANWGGDTVFATGLLCGMKNFINDDIAFFIQPSVMFKVQGEGSGSAVGSLDLGFSAMF